MNHRNEYPGQSMCSKCPPPACTHDLRWSHQHRWCSGQSQYGVYIKHFRRSSMSWIFVSCTLCCITPQLSTCKAYDDPGPLWWSMIHLMQFSLMISHCNITFSSFRISQGCVATLIRWGGWSSYCHMCRSFLNRSVKTALRSVDFWQSYRQK